MTSVPPPGGGGDGAPRCPRHPDVVAYVRCQRCGRPACPACQVPAAVGVQCVDCVAEAKRAVRPTRTALGAPLRTGYPLVTLSIIAVTVVSFVLQLTVGDAWTDRLLFAPVLGWAEPWRFVSVALLHSPGMILHIAFNMYALYILGGFLERELGRWRFGALYVLSAVAGSVGSLLLATTPTAWFTAVIGASGAVFGLFGAVFVVLRKVGGNVRTILVLLVLNGVMGFVVPGIAWESHLGGFVGGLLLGAAFAHAPRDRRTEVSVAAVVGLAVLLVLLAVLRYQVF